MNALEPYEEIVDFIAAGSTPQAVVAFRPSTEAQTRVAMLVGRSKVGRISNEEQAELDDYMRLEHLMVMAKARARRFTQLAP